MTNIEKQLEKLLHTLINIKLKVIISGEFERNAYFWDLLDLLYKYSDFSTWTDRERLDYFKESIKDKSFYIDANTTALMQ